LTEDIVPPFGRDQAMEPVAKAHLAGDAIDGVVAAAGARAGPAFDPLPAHPHPRDALRPSSEPSPALPLLTLDTGLFLSRGALRLAHEDLLAWKHCTPGQSKSLILAAVARPQ